MIAGAGYSTSADADLRRLTDLAARDKKAAGDSISLVAVSVIGRAFTFDVKLSELYEYMSQK